MRGDLPGNAAQPALPTAVKRLDAGTMLDEA